MTRPSQDHFKQHTENAMRHETTDGIETLRKAVQWADSQDESYWRPAGYKNPSVEEIIELFNICQEVEVTPEVLIATVPWKAPEWLLRRFTGWDLVQSTDKLLEDLSFDVTSCEGADCCNPPTRCDICREKNDQPSEMEEDGSIARFHINEGPLIDVCRRHLLEGLKKVENFTEK